MTDVTETYYLPVLRTGSDDLRRQQHLFDDFEMLDLLGQTVPGGLLILNDQREIVFANDTFQGQFSDREAVLGMRLGEAVSCEHSSEDPAGCGTTEHCVHCGAARAMKHSLEGRPASEECRIIRDPAAGGEMALDLRVWSTPFNYQAERFHLFSTSDISHEKRREALEKIFFHDVLNTASLITGVADMLHDQESLDPAHRQEFNDMLVVASHRLIDEIESHHLLLNAESGELEMQCAPLNTRDFLSQLVYLFQSHEVARDRTVTLAEQCEDVLLYSDTALLSRVLGNMIKNGLEASPAGATITVSCRKIGADVRFSVHNPGYMPRHVQMQLFQRSFSTKGSGRGLGTYSMKLLSERYLHGAVSFTSTPESGTTFFALYPLERLE